MEDKSNYTGSNPMSPNNTSVGPSQKPPSSIQQNGQQNGQQQFNLKSK